MSIYDVESSQALKGLKVLQLGLSGMILFITRFFADYGATVIWIESQTHPDIMRSSAPYFGGIVSPNRSCGVIPCSTSSFSMGVNIRKPKGVEIVKRLAGWADIITASYAPGVLEKRGLGYKDLQSINPGAIVVTGSALGDSGPFARLPGFGWTQKALCGVNEYTGWPDREPTVGPPLAYPDHCVPFIAFPAIMAALEYRRATGKGQHVEFSQLEGMLSFVPAHLLLQYTANREVPTRLGNRSPDGAPCGAFPCRGEDRWCVISVRTDEEWRRLARVIGLRWTNSRRFATFPRRKENEDELEKLIAGWTAGLTPHQVMERLQAAGVAAGVVQNYAEILEQDPQMKHRGFFTKLSRPELEDVSHSGWPARLSRTPAVMRPTPRLGEHTYTICKEVLNMSDDEFTALLNEGVLEVT
ncbi:MAG: CoA transferase [Chloroflexota bacterium]